MIYLSIQVLCCVVTLFSSAIAQKSDYASIAFTSNPQFTYTYKTEIVYNYHNGFELSPKIEKLATVLNRYLGQSMFFNTEFLSDIKKVRKYHLKHKPNHANIGKIINVLTVDNKELGCTYFDRGSDSVLFIGAGFTNERELMSPFIDMFPDYDIVIFDFRGHGYDHNKVVMNPIKKAFGIKANEVTFGVDEHRDVFAVVEWFRRIKKKINKGIGYKKVYGLGVCYSAFVFTKAAALAERLRSDTDKVLQKEFAEYDEVRENGLFDKLILDGCWLSLPLFVGKILEDIQTLVNPQTGGWKNHWFWGKRLVRGSLDFVATHLVGLRHHANICLLDYVDDLKKTPLLFFFGKDDYMIRRHEFETLYNAIQSPEKTVIITSNPHVRNHLKQKELYKLCCDLFLQLPQEEFITCLQQPKMIVQYSAQQFMRACGQVMGGEKNYRFDELMWPLMMTDE